MNGREGQADQGPAAAREMLARRARITAQVRRFMEQRDILEVETPVLSRFGNTDPHIHSLETRLRFRGDRRTCYLHTSPEFAMKRLLAAGSGSIYQICRVFRDDEPGPLHQPEFTMLEWYRIGFDHHRLMDEAGNLLESLGLARCERCSYAEVFTRHCRLDPHTAHLEDLQHLAQAAGLAGREEQRSILLDFLFSHRVMPHLGLGTPLWVYDFPTCQAALARIRGSAPPLAERFELFINGFEIANGYNELTDYNEVNSRFWQENEIRRGRGLAEMPVDRDLLAALRQGLPECAGVAMGLDRLLMVLSDHRELDSHPAFPGSRD